MPTTTAAQTLRLIACHAFRFRVFQTCQKAWLFLMTKTVMTMFQTEADAVAVVVASLHPPTLLPWHSLVDLMICQLQLPMSQVFRN
jgi:hypothetical protein